jgi:hypothetical protein
MMSEMQPGSLFFSRIEAAINHLLKETRASEMKKTLFPLDTSAGRSLHITAASD